MKTIITVTGIRPDFIRMSEIFKKLDSNFNHILIHTGQHFDKLLSDVFFQELEIRKPDFNLEIGGKGKKHYHQMSELTIKLIELIEEKNLNPDLIVFLGDSNSVISSVSLKKEGYKIAHIEAGMRSGDKRMLEEINRIVCDHCSDFLFVYHDNYKEKLLKENINGDNIFVVGNTIVEVVKKYYTFDKGNRNQIILDIHRPENFNDKKRLENIIKFANQCKVKYNVEVTMLSFSRTVEKLKEFNIDLGGVQLVELLSFKQYLKQVSNSIFLISDSGTAQEEPSLLRTPVLVPRDYTERPESVDSHCSLMVNVNNDNFDFESINQFLNTYNESHSTEWLGDGQTSDKIINKIKEIL
jgi:UDP-N-acetylglucosamine 2-epimerase (non-hydrolysing)